MTRAFRFGFQYRNGTADELRAMARDAETAGFDVFHSWDHVVDGWAPLAPLLSAAEATTRLRICPLVINNDFHHPVHLARELTSMDHLTGGRVELGIGAGHSFDEYDAIGQRFDHPAVRKARMAEAIEVLRPLLDGERVTFHGEHYDISDAKVLRARQDRLPILVGVNGKRALAHAARHADIIGLMMMGKTLEDGHRHEVRWESWRLDATIEHIRASVPAGAAMPELNALVQAVIITDDRRAAAEEFAAEHAGLSIEDTLETPFLAIGTHDEIADHCRRARERWGISYFSVREIDGFQPVIERLRVDDAA